MKRTKWSLWLLAATGAAVLLMLAWPKSDEATPVRMVRVTLGSIEDVAAITGRLTYTDETAVYAASTGLVSQVYVDAGDRVAEGDALVRLDASLQEEAVSAWLAAEEAAGSDAFTDLLSMDSTVIRAPMNATVRQVFIQKDAGVTAGTPVMMLSSTSQVIVCAVLEADARRIQPGMRAMLYASGEEAGTAYVESVGEQEAELTTGQVIRTVTLQPETRIDLPAGAAIEVDVHVAGREQVPVLPVEAVTEAGTVWWVHDGICTEIPAETVLSDEINVWVRLPEGLAVALGELKEGQRVTEVQP